MPIKATTRCAHAPQNLYEINTRVWLHELGISRLEDVPEATLDEIASLGFHSVWLMGVWEPSAHGAEVARKHAGLRDEFARALPDLTETDIVASPYAIARYEVSPLIGGVDDLRRFRGRLARRNIGLILDFVPNHTACDHPLLESHPEYYVGAERGAPPAETFVTRSGARIYCGRDPYFPPWTDTAQLDYRRASTRRAMIGELSAVAELCDGVRCDMAMLLLSDIFRQTWSRPGVAGVPSEDEASGEFWVEAIDAVRKNHPGFFFMAEAYWGTEPHLQSLGFDATYDKSLYDAVLAGGGERVVSHLLQSRSSERRSVRFLENHDEERIAHRLSPRMHRAAAMVTLLLPGVRFIHHGQLHGAKAKVPVQLKRRRREEADVDLAGFYRSLLAMWGDLVLAEGTFRLIGASAAWPGNASHHAFVAYGWDGSLLGAGFDGSHRLLVANLAEHRAQCRLPVDFPGLRGRTVHVAETLASAATPAGDETDLVGRPIYVRKGTELVDAGLFVDLPGQTAQLLRLSS